MTSEQLHSLIFNKKKELNLSSYKLGQMSGIHRQIIEEWMNDVNYNPRKETILALINALGIELIEYKPNNIVNEIKQWMLFDGRYRTQNDDAICYEVCDSLKEAKENAIDYGDDTVIVEACIVGNVIMSSKIVN